MNRPNVDYLHYLLVLADCLRSSVRTLVIRNILTTSHVKLEGTFYKYRIISPVPLKAIHQLLGAIALTIPDPERKEIFNSINNYLTQTSLPYRLELMEGKGYKIIDLT